MKIAIIGGGACGLLITSLLQDKLGNNDSIDIIEKEDKVGKKLLLTGNGRGNISNVNMSSCFYNDEFAAPIINAFTPNDLINYFDSLGVLTFNDLEGRVYPRSETASTILNALRESYINNPKVKELTGINLKTISKNKDKYLVNGNIYDVVVVSVGSKANSKDYNDYLLKELKHSSTSVYPALTPLFVKENTSSLKGLHAKVKATLKMKEVYETSGELLFKEDSLSGIVMFELSSFYARNKIKGIKEKAIISLDMLKEYSNEEIFNKLINLKELSPFKNASFLLNGFFPKMIAKYILDRSKVEYKNKNYGDLNKKDLEKITNTIKELTFTINENKIPTNGQIIVGGICLNEVDNNTLESKLNKNLYLGGEVLNIDGKCGGYNLHFAFACAKKIATMIEEKLC